MGKLCTSKQHQDQLLDLKQKSCGKQLSIKQLSRTVNSFRKGLRTTHKKACWTECKLVKFSKASVLAPALLSPVNGQSSLLWFIPNSMTCRALQWKWNLSPFVLYPAFSSIAFASLSPSLEQKLPQSWNLSLPRSPNTCQCWHLAGIHSRYETFPSI